MTDILALTAALKAGKVTVDFTKVNGMKRTMVATLSPSILPPTKDDGKTNKAKDKNLLVVYDTQMNGWRTIRVDSVASWEIGETASSAKPAEVTPPTVGWTPKTGTPTA